MSGHGKTVGKDYTQREFVDGGLGGYYADCNFNGLTFDRCEFDCVLYNCNFQDVILIDPTIKRFTCIQTSLEGLDIKRTKEADCEITTANMARNHSIIAEIMRRKGSLLPEPLKTKCLEAAELVRTRHELCWGDFKLLIPDEVWAQSEYGFGDEDSILKAAIRTRDK